MQDDGYQWRTRKHMSLVNIWHFYRKKFLGVFTELHQHFSWTYWKDDCIGLSTYSTYRTEQGGLSILIGDSTITSIGNNKVSLPNIMQFFERILCRLMLNSNGNRLEYNELGIQTLLAFVPRLCQFSQTCDSFEVCKV